MQITAIEALKSLEGPAGGSTAFVAPQVENATQRVLRRALELLGPNGEHWMKGDYRQFLGRYIKRPPLEALYVVPDDLSASDYCVTYEVENRYAYCSLGAVREVIGHSEFFRASPNVGWCDSLRAAALERGFPTAWHLNDEATYFSEVRAMFERAIVLAGTDQPRAAALQTP
jgi:hypothetical protein